MHQPASLRPQEEVIDQFGVSAKYTVLLVAIGAIVALGGLLVRIVWSDAFNNTAIQLGLFGPLVVNGAVLAVALVGLYLIGLGLFFRVAYHYYFTTERVIESVGWLSQVTVSAEYKHLTDLIVRQDPISHLVLNTGTLAVNTAGGPKEEIVLINIDNPTARREQLRGLAAATQNGKKVTRALLHELKQQTGMPDETPDMSDKLITPAALPDEVPLVTPIIVSKSALLPKDEQIEDLHGDGIDESDRLRAAQKKVLK